MIATAAQLVFELNSQSFVDCFQKLNGIEGLQIRRIKSEYANSIFLIQTKEEDKYFFKQSKSQTLDNLEFFENERNYYNSFSKENSLVYFENIGQRYFIFPGYDSLELIQIRDELWSEKILNKKNLNNFLKKIGKAVRLFRKIEGTSLQTFKDKSTAAIQPKYQYFLIRYEKFLKTDNIEYLINEDIRFRETSEVKQEVEGILKSRELKEILSNVALQEDDLIHGDLELRNILINTQQPDNPQHTEEYRLIDFEMVSFGDSMWDSACLFESINSIYFDRDGYSNIKELRYLLFKSLFEQLYDQKLNEQEIKRFLIMLIIKRLFFVLSVDEANKDQFTCIHETIKNFKDVVEGLATLEKSSKADPLFLTFYSPTK